MQQNDISDVSKIYCNVFNELGESWSLETAVSHVSDAFDKDTCWVALMNNDIKGFLISSILPWDKGDVLFVDTIAVDRDFRKIGIGNLLWNEADKFVQENSLKGIRLLADPKLISFDWYKRNGFKKSGWIELYK